MSESTGDATAELDLVSFVWSVYDDLVAIAYMGTPCSWPTSKGPRTAEPTSPSSSPGSTTLGPECWARATR